MNGFFAILKKELRSVGRERTIVIAIVIQLFVASFSSAILIGLLSFYDPDAISANVRLDLHVGILGNPNPLALFLRGHHVRVSTFANPADAEDAFHAGRLDVILFVPVDNGGSVEMKMFLPRSETLSSMILILLREPLKQYENYVRQARGVHIQYTDIRGLPSTTFEFLYAIIIPILMFFPAFVAGSLVIDSLSEELETHTLETLWSAPVSLSAIFGAKIAAPVLLAAAQGALWLILLRLNGIDIQNLGLVLLLAILVAALNALGSAFATFSLRDRERSQFLYALFILIAVSASYFFDFSPVKLMTRLAVGDYYVGFFDVAQYAVVLLVLVAVFFHTTRKLAVV